MAMDLYPAKKPKDAIAVQRGEAAWEVTILRHQPTMCQNMITTLLLDG